MRSNELPVGSGLGLAPDLQDEKVHSEQAQPAVAPRESKISLEVKNASAAKSTPLEFPEEIVQDMNNWIWEAPIGGGANAESAPLSGRYKLKRAVLARLKVNLLPTDQRDNKEVVEKINAIAEIEQKNQKQITDINREIAYWKGQQKNNSAYRKICELTDYIEYLRLDGEQNRERKLENAAKIENLGREVEKTKLANPGLARFDKKIADLKTTKKIITDSIQSAEKQLQEELLKLTPKNQRKKIKSDIKQLDALGENIVFFKREGDIAKNICEIVAGKLSHLFSNAIYGEEKEKPLFARVTFAHSSNPNEKPYVASVGIPGFEDLYLDAHKAYNFNPQFDAQRMQYGFIPIPTTRPPLAGSLNKHPMHDVVSSYRYEGAEIFYAMAILLDDPDIHYANLGAVPKRKSGDRYKKHIRMNAARIDYAASLGGSAIRKFDGEIHYDAYLRYFPGVEPTPHKNEFPTLHRVSKPFIACLENLATKLKGNDLKVGITSIINEVVVDIKKNSTSAEVIRDLKLFADKIGAVIDENGNLEKIKAQLIEFLYDNLTSRQKALQELAIEFKLSLCFERVSRNIPKQGLKLATPRKNSSEHYNLLDVIAENPEYFPLDKYSNEYFTFPFRGKWPTYFKVELSEITKNIANNFFKLQMIVDGELKYDFSAQNQQHYKKFTDLNFEFTDLNVQFEALKTRLKNNSGPESKLEKLSSSIQKLIESQKAEFQKISDRPEDANAARALFNKIHILRISIKNLNDSCGSVARLNLFARTYNRQGEYSSGLAAFFSWPRNVTVSSFLGFIVKNIVNLPLNILKLGTEFLPAVLAKGFKELCTECINYFKNPHRGPLGVGIGFLAGIGVIVFGATWLALKAVQLIGKRITSPIHAFKESYSWGKEKYGRVFGGVMATASAIVSLVGIAAIATIALPVLALTGVSAVATKIVSLKYVSTVWNGVATAVSFVGNYLGSALSTIGLGAITSGAAVAVTFGAVMIARGLANVAKGLWDQAKTWWDNRSANKIDSANRSKPSVQGTSPSLKGSIAATTEQGSQSGMESKTSPERQSSHSDTQSVVSSEESSVDSVVPSDLGGDTNSIMGRLLPPPVSPKSFVAQADASEVKSAQVKALSGRRSSVVDPAQVQRMQLPGEAEIRTTRSQSDPGNLTLFRRQLQDEGALVDFGAVHQNKI